VGTRDPEAPLKLGDSIGQQTPFVIQGRAMSGLTLEPETHEMARTATRSHTEDARLPASILWEYEAVASCKSE
jgi:hypothetical protein